MNAERFPAVAAARAEGRVLADNGACAQVPRETIDAIRAYLTNDNAQRGSIFSRAERTSAVVDGARAAFAEFIGTDPGSVGFGPNATSIAFALARTLAPAIRPGDRIVVTATDHEANVAPWMWLGSFGAVIDVVGVDGHGDLDRAAYATALKKEPVVVALPWASNATGTIFDVAGLAREAKAVGALVIVDGVQAAPHFPLDIPGDVDVVFFSAYKIFAPHFGAWYATSAFAQRFFVGPDEFVRSAGVAWSIETGTQNYEGLAGWLGTTAYLREVGGGSLRAGMTRIAEEERALGAYARQAFAQRPHLRVLGGPLDRERLPLFAFTMRDESPDAVARALAGAQIEARLGDYYSPRLLRALSPGTQGQAVRLSFAHYNDRSDVDRALAVLDAIAGVVPA